MYKIYSREGCRFCELAKKFMDERGLEYKEIRLDPESEDYVRVRDELIEKTGQRTFPWIFEEEKFIGGYTELARYGFNEDF